ncbi:MAG: proton-conducting membrane transporter, partial [Lachnospiraceae bacterium]|nr:proton-conducting membrane transporter [Lachnospiraceae bacterium]
KKRLAYSTISQVSYILFGLVTMTDVAYKGAMLQFIAHAFAKCALFLMAGLMIKISGSVYVKDLKGIGRKYPLLLWCFTICSLSMIGIPPTGGFIAKWYLIEGSLNSDYYNFPWSGPMFLLLSALLTAGYLLPIVLRGFFPGEEFEDNNIEKIKIPAYVYVSVIVLTAMAVLVGICPGIFVGGGM